MVGMRPAGVVATVALATMISLPASVAVSAAPPVVRGGQLPAVAAPIPPADAPAEVRAAFPGLAASLRQLDAELTDADVWAAWESQQARLLFLEDIGDTQGLAGATYDYRGHMLHVWVTEAADKAEVMAEAAAHGVSVVIDLAPYSPEELDDLVARVAAAYDIYGTNPLGLGIAAEPTLGYVEVGVPNRELLGQLSAELAFDPRIRVEIVEGHFVPTVCPKGGCMPQTSSDVAVTGT